MEKEIICVVCPSSCRITIIGEGKNVESVIGFTCGRGKEYALNEFTTPVRMLSTTVKAVGYVSPIIAVRSDKPIPKDMQFSCMEVIRNIQVKAPFEMGRIIVANILNTGANIILANC